MGTRQSFLHTSSVRRSLPNVYLGSLPVVGLYRQDATSWQRPTTYSISCMAVRWPADTTVRCQMRTRRHRCHGYSRIHTLAGSAPVRDADSDLSVSCET